MQTGVVRIYANNNGRAIFRAFSPRRGIFRGIIRGGYLGPQSLARRQHSGAQ